MSDEERTAVQEWWAASDRGDRGRDDRLRHGHRQGRRALRLPLQPAQGARELLARRSAAPGRDGAPAIVRAARLPGRRARRSRTSPTATRRPARRSPACSPSCSQPRGRRVRRRRVRALDSPRRAPARAPDAAHLPRARRASCGRARLSTPATGCGRPAASLDESSVASTRARADFLRRLIAAARRAASGRRIAPDDAAAALGEERSRIVAALEYLDEQGLVELKAAEARQRYTVAARRTTRPRSSSAGGALRTPRARRDRAHPERARARDPDGCQVRALVAYFGETRAEPCGHCSHCLTGSAQQLPQLEPRPQIDAVVDEAALDSLRSSNPDSLGTPRKAARFLAGITSPATTRAKLTRHRLFGSLADRRFLEIVAWCEGKD